MAKVKVQRTIQTTYTFLPDRFCTYCGIKGIYEDDDPDGPGDFCFSCACCTELHNPSASLPRLIAREPVVVDLFEYETEVDEITLVAEQVGARMLSKFLTDEP